MCVRNFQTIILYIALSIIISILLLFFFFQMNNFGYLVPRPLSFFFIFLWLFFLLPLSIMGFGTTFILALKQNQPVAQKSLFFLALCSIFFIVNVSLFLHSRNESILLGQLGDLIVQKLQLYKEQNGSYPEQFSFVLNTFTSAQQNVIEDQFDYSLIQSNSREGFSLRYEFGFFSWLRGCEFFSLHPSPLWNCYPD